MTGRIINSLLIAGIVPVLIAQPVRAEVVQVTGVKVNLTDNSWQIILETSSSKPLQVLTSSYGTTFVANIINTQLALPESNSFRSNNPIEGIAAVEVTQQSGNSIRVSVISNAGVPTAEVTQSDRGLVLSVAPSADTRAEQPTPTPETLEEQPLPTDETTPEQAEGDEQIEIVVTASRSEEAVTADQAIAKYNQQLTATRKQLADLVAADPRLLLLASNDLKEYIDVRTSADYTGGILQDLGFQLVTPPGLDKKAELKQISLEVLPTLNADRIIVLVWSANFPYDLDKVKQEWNQNQQLAKDLPASRNGRMYFVDYHLWINIRGAIAAEAILKQAQNLVETNY